MAEEGDKTVCDTSNLLNQETVGLEGDACGSENREMHSSHRNVAVAVWGLLD